MPLLPMLTPNAAHSSVQLACAWLALGALSTAAHAGGELVPADPAPASQTDDDRFESLERRIDVLEQENAELRDGQDALSDSYERFTLGGLVPPIVPGGIYGLGPAASKIYTVDQGVSIGGYGELIYQNFSGSQSDEFDFRRAIIYLGYKFDQNWVLNTEFEFEHASTGENGSVSVEFATLDYLYTAALNFRVGLLLIPMGFINELHEPITYPTSNRPQTEQRIIPTTWRENGAGVFGQAGNLSYRAYVVNGFDGKGFEADGLRGGRQKGSEALAEDLAVVGRLDYAVTPELGVGGSIYWGDSGQDQSGLGDVETTIFEGHAEWNWKGANFRALYSRAHVEDAEDINAVNGLVGDESVGEELEGWYLQGAFDVLTLVEDSRGMQLLPFIKYEQINTQVDVPGGFSSDSNNDYELVTVGIDFKPIPNIVFKADYQDFHGTDIDDAFNLTMGYAF